MTVCDVGKIVRLGATFTPAGGVPTNPTSVALVVRAPDGAGGWVTTSPAPVSEGAGVYHYDYQPAQAGYHTYRWSGTGVVTTAEEGRFYVRPGAVG